MTNPWANPNPTNALPAQQQPGAFAPVAALTTAQALDGIDTADMQTRYPALPDGFNGTVEVVSVRRNKPKPGQQYFMTYFFESKVMSSDTHPSAVGQVATVKINGFESPKGRTYAIRDLKALLTLLYAPDGLTPQTQMSTEQWAQCADSAVGDGSKVLGRKFGVQARLLTGGIKPKVVHTFFAVTSL